MLSASEKNTTTASGAFNILLISLEEVADTVGLFRVI
jgi:hypothetical protein